MHRLPISTPQNSNIAQQKAPITRNSEGQLIQTNSAQSTQPKLRQQPSASSVPRATTETSEAAQQWTTTQAPQQSQVRMQHERAVPAHSQHVQLPVQLSTTNGLGAMTKAPEIRDQATRPESGPFFPFTFAQLEQQFIQGQLAFIAVKPTLHPARLPTAQNQAQPNNATHSQSHAVEVTRELGMPLSSLNLKNVGQNQGQTLQTVREMGAHPTKPYVNNHNQVQQVQAVQTVRDIASHSTNSSNLNYQQQKARPAAVTVPEVTLGRSSSIGVVSSNSNLSSGAASSVTSTLTAAPALTLSSSNVLESVPSVVTADPEWQKVPDVSLDTSDESESYDNFDPPSVTGQVSVSYQWRRSSVSGNSRNSPSDDDDSSPLFTVPNPNEETSATSNIKHPDTRVLPTIVPLAQNVMPQRTPPPPPGPLLVSVPITVRSPECGPFHPITFEELEKQFLAGILNFSSHSLFTGLQHQTSATPVAVPVQDLVPVGISHNSTVSKGEEDTGRPMPPLSAIFRPRIRAAPPAIGSVDELSKQPPSPTSLLSSSVTPVFKQQIRQITKPMGIQIHAPLSGRFTPVTFEALELEAAVLYPMFMRQGSATADVDIVESERRKTQRIPPSRVAVPNNVEGFAATSIAPVQRKLSNPGLDCSNSISPNITARLSGNSPALQPTASNPSTNNPGLPLYPIPSNSTVRNAVFISPTSTKTSNSLNINSPSKTSRSTTQSPSAEQQASKIRTRADSTSSRGLPSPPSYSYSRSASVSPYESRASSSPSSLRDPPGKDRLVGASRSLSTVDEKSILDAENAAPRKSDAVGAQENNSPAVSSSTSSTTEASSSISPAFSPLIQSQQMPALVIPNLSSYTQPPPLTIPTAQIPSSSATLTNSLAPPQPTQANSIGASVQPVEYHRSSSSAQFASAASLLYNAAALTG